MIGMNEGMKYLVFFDDGKIVRGKTLVYRRTENGYEVFYNPVIQREESIPISRIVRVEEI